MSNPQTSVIIEEIDVSHIVTEDDTPVDNWFSEKQQRLLVKTLYASWQRERPFVAGADIGVFASPHQPPVVPDVLVSLDAELAEDWYAKQHRSYFIWEFGKPPEIVVEVVSNKEGGELSRKLQRYAQLRILYYIIFDPQTLIQNEPIALYELIGMSYQKRDDLQLSWLDLGLTLWQGKYEGQPSTYLRWTQSDGTLLPNDEELIAQAQKRADLLAQKLRELGIDPDVLV